MKFRLICNDCSFSGSVLDQVTQTVQDASLQLSDIIANYTRGITNVEVHDYDTDDSDINDDSDFVDPRNDIVDDELTYNDELKSKVTDAKNVILESIETQKRAQESPSTRASEDDRTSAAREKATP
jgi:predicted RNA-binding protein with PUA-like domain